MNWLMLPDAFESCPDLLAGAALLLGGLDRWVGIEASFLFSTTRYDLPIPSVDRAWYNRANTTRGGDAIV